MLELENAEEKYLAIKIPEKLESSGKYGLTDDQKRVIKKIRISHNKVPVCSGCTYSTNVSLRRMFRKGNFIAANYWLEEIFNQLKKMVRAITLVIFLNLKSEH